MGTEMTTTDDEESSRAALEVLARNRRRGRAAYPQFSYDYTCPSPDTYPFQWNWDSAFHAIALARADPGRAQQELITLLTSMQPRGFLPHMVLWQHELRERAKAEFTIAVAAAGWYTLTVQPPVLPLAVERVWEHGRDDTWLRSVLPELISLMIWFKTYRDPDETGLVSIFQPDESGLDMSPKYDVLLGTGDGGPDGVVPRWHKAVRRLIAAYAGRGPETDLRSVGLFVWQDVLVNVIFALSCRALARLLRQVGDPTSADDFERHATNTTRVLIEQCWDERSLAFYDTYSGGRAGLTQVRQARVLTATSLFPLVLPDLPKAYVDPLVAHLTNEAEFWLPFPVPSVAATEPAFDAMFRTSGIFRGSSWVNLNWFLQLGLREHGLAEVADDLCQRTKTMVARSGLRECYGPFDAVGHGARDFSWSALVLDM
jgi:hypothetical protein